MDSKAKRSWFSFHLLTAVLMMIAAGILLGINICRRDVLVCSQPGVYGWPAYYYVLQGMRHWQFHTEAIAVDVMTAVCLIVTVGATTESLLRRREARKT